MLFSEVTRDESTASFSKATLHQCTSLHYEQTEVCNGTLQGLEPCAEFQQCRPPV